MGALTRRQRLHDRARTYNILQIGVGIYEGLVPRQGGKILNPITTKKLLAEKL